MFSVYLRHFWCILQALPVLEASQFKPAWLGGKSAHDTFPLFPHFLSLPHFFFSSRGLTTCVSPLGSRHYPRKICNAAYSSEFVGGLEVRGSRTPSLYANSHETTSKRVFSRGWQAALIIMPLLRLKCLSTQTARSAIGMDLQ